MESRFQSHPSGKNPRLWKLPEPSPKLRTGPRLLHEVLPVPRRLQTLVLIGSMGMAGLPATFYVTEFLSHTIHGTGIFAYMKTIKNPPTIGKYTIHGWYGYGKCRWNKMLRKSERPLSKPKCPSYISSAWRISWCRIYAELSPFCVL